MVFLVSWGAAARGEPLWSEGSEATALGDGVLRGDSFVELATRAAPAVVNVVSFRSVGDLLDLGQAVREGSGFIVNASGYVVTNAHVVEGARVVHVTLHDRREFVAEVVGLDLLSDLALLHIGAVALPVVLFGDSDGVRVGEWVMAIGSPMGLQQSVSVGVVSAKERMHPELFTEFIQTDASINPGSSGGPLFNLRGEVVGVITAINPRATGIGFAVPINVAKALLPMLLEGEVVMGWLGAVVQAVPGGTDAVKLPRGEGAWVAQVVADGPAQRAGLEPGDVVLSLDGQRVDHQRLKWLVSVAGVGAEVELGVLRRGELVGLRVVLEAAPREVVAVEREGALPMAGVEGASSLGIVGRRGYGLGSEEEVGVEIVAVVPGGPAALAGVIVGDLLLQVDDQGVESISGLEFALAGRDDEGWVVLELVRGRARLSLAVVLP